MIVNSEARHMQIWNFMKDLFTLVVNFLAFDSLFEYAWRGGSVGSLEELPKAWFWNWISSDDSLTVKLTTCKS